MNPFSFIRCALLLVFLTGPVLLPAQDMSAVKARITQRLGAVNDLKDRLIAGENNQGFLELRGKATAAEQKTLTDENADRRAVYAALAAQTGAGAETVGRQRAQQLASIAKRGVWIQDAAGEWRQKG
jgi:uncharacterized protein YdbL (DUF1318 family)